MGGHFLFSARSWVVFLGAELILAGVLIVLGAFSGWALIAIGILLLTGLWLVEQRRTQVRSALFRAIDWWLPGGDPRGVNASPLNVDTSASHAITHAQTIATWRNMVADFEKAYKANRNARIEDCLTNKPEYYRLEQYLSRDTMDAIRAVTSGIKLRPALMIRGDDTLEQAVIRKLQQDIARMERAVSIPIEERKRLIAEAYSMIDVVEKQYQQGKLEEHITSFIRRKREYQRIEPHLSQITRDMLNPRPGIVEVFNGGTIEEHVIERLRRELADLERQWGLA